MNLRQLQYICALSRHRHFGHAADSCNISQPTLSSQVRKLEEELVVQIFERLKGEVQLTDVGEKIIDIATSACAVATEIRELAAASRGPLAGTLSLGVIPTIGRYLLPRFSGQLAAFFPRITPSFVEEVTEKLLECLTSDEVDMAVIASTPDSRSFKSLPICRDRFYAALPDGHFLCGCQEIGLSDIESETLL